MKCLYCSHNETQVIDSRDSEDLSSIRRRRICLKCGKRFTTYEKRPISMGTITEVTDEIEQALRKYETTEIPSKVIGEMVIKKLKALDKVAYIRFASVY